MIANIIRVLLALAALVVIFLTPLFRETNGQTQILTDGLVIDAIAVAVLVAVAWTWLRSRRAPAA